jgi:hypothetical protein
LGFSSVCVFSLLPQVTNIGTGWRTFYLLWTIPSAISIAFAFFLILETYFIRLAPVTPGGSRMAFGHSQSVFVKGICQDS